MKKRILILLFLALYFLFSIYTYKDYGNTVDEFFNYTRGRYFYTKVRGNDRFLQKGFVVKERNNEDLLYYNSTYPALLYVLNGSESYEKYHLLNMLFTSVIFYIFYEVLLFVYKKPVLALIGPVFLFFTPRFLGHIPANPKDVPFASVYFITLAVLFFCRQWEQKIRILAIGISIGIAASLRNLGFTLIPIYFLFVIGEWLLAKKDNMIKSVGELILENVLIFIVSFLIFMVSMPYIGADPFNHLIELLQINKNYPWNGQILYFGRLISTSDRPVSYLFAWITVTTPLFLLALSAGSLFLKLQKRAATLRNLIILSMVIQIILYVAIHPVIYNGLRHYLFLMPQIAILAAICFSELSKKKTIAILAGIIIVLNIGSVIKSYIELHPYEYVYFNGLIGGLAGANGKLELDYWGASEKEALLWLDNYLKSNNKPKANIYVCSKSNSLAYYLPQQNDVNRYPAKAQYIVCDNPAAAKIIATKKKLTLMNTVKRQNTVLQYIYRVEAN